MGIPERQGIIVLANVGHELLGELATGVELGEVADNGSPNEVAATRVRFGGVEVEGEGVLEGGYGLGNVAGELVKLLVEEGRVLGYLGGWVVFHEDLYLFHHVLVAVAAPRPALQGCGHSLVFCFQPPNEVIWGEWRRRFRRKKRRTVIVVVMEVLVSFRFLTLPYFCSDTMKWRRVRGMLVFFDKIIFLVF